MNIMQHIREQIEALQALQTKGGLGGRTEITTPEGDNGRIVLSKRKMSGSYPLAWFPNDAEGLSDVTAIKAAQDQLPQILEALGSVVELHKNLKNAARAKRRLAKTWHSQGHTGMALKTKMIANHTETVAAEIEVALGDAFGLLDAEALTVTIEGVGNGDETETGTTPETP